MEHSYTRDWRTTPRTDIMTTRTILMERAPLCSLCHTSSPNHTEKLDHPEVYNIPVPPYNEDDGTKALFATHEMIKNCPNRVSDTDDWTASINKVTWTEQQKTLFERMERILDMDQMARLAIVGLPNECLRRNAIIEKSMSRLRQALASVQWEPRVTQWFHALMMTHLSQTYMVSYIDMLRLLKNKIPTLVDKMLYDRPIDVHMDYGSAILRPSWEPTMATKTRALPGQTVVVIVPSGVSLTPSPREKQLHDLLSTLATVELVRADAKSIPDDKSTYAFIAEQIVALTRARIQAIRNEKPVSNIVLVGFNAGAAIALQVAIVEPVSSVICLGFAFNTMNGVRGNIDDRILEITTPILFIIGQNAQRSSQEEIESLREKLAAQSSLVVVGSSDDALNVKRLNRVMPGVTQSMIDNMIVDEVHEFAVACILNPPAPRKPGYYSEYRRSMKQQAHDEPKKKSSKLGRPRTKNVAKVNGDAEHRNHTESSSELEEEPPTKTQRYQLSVDNSSGYESANLTDPIECDIPNGRSYAEDRPAAASPSIRQKVKLIPSNQFLHLKPPPVNIQKIYKTQDANGSQSYTLGVNNIGSADIGMVHTKHITLTNDCTVQKPAAQRNSIQIIKTPTKATHSGERRNGEHWTGSSAGIDSMSSNQLNTASSQPIMVNGHNGDNVTANGLNGTNISNTTDAFQPMDILSAKVVDDAICLNGLHYQGNGVNGAMHEEFDLKDIDVLDDEEDDEQPVNGDQTHTDQIQMLNMLDNDVDVLNETVETIDTIESSPSKHPSSHLNGGEFVLLNGSNQLKNIKYQKFVIADKPTILNASNGSNGMKTMMNGNGSKFRLVRPFERFIKGDTANKMTPKQSVQLLNGKVRVGRNGEQTNRSGFIIKRLAVNGTAIKQNITVRRVNLVRLNEKQTEPAIDSDVDETKDINVIDVDDIDDERHKSAQDLISQLED